MSESSDEIKEIKKKILEKIADETTVKPTRIPAPKNITEVGGYFNLLAKMEKDNNETRIKLIKSALGIPV